VAQPLMDVDADMALICAYFRGPLGPRAQACGPNFVLSLIYRFWPFGGGQTCPVFRLKRTSPACLKVAERWPNSRLP